VADQDSDRQVERRGPDVLTLIAGVATLLVSSYVLTDGAIRISGPDLRWVIAGGALLVGLLLLIASLRGRKR
jgi:hypothetical protein